VARATPHAWQYITDANSLRSTLDWALLYILVPEVLFFVALALLHKSKKVDMTPTPDAATPQQAPPPLWGTQVA
jgi:hypothetical protein